MNKFMTRTASLALATVLGVTMLGGCGSEELDGSKAAITIDDVDVPAGVLSFAIRYSQAQMESYYGAYMSQMMGGDGTSTSDFLDEEAEDGVTYGEQLRQGQLEEIEKMYVTRAKADEYGLEITEEQQAEIDEAAAAFIEANDADMLTKIGVTEENVKEYLELSTIYDAALEPVTADSDLEVTDDEAATTTVTYAFMSTNNLEDDDEETRAVYEEEMAQLLEQIQASEDPSTVDFSELAEAIDESILASSTSYRVNAEEDEDNVADKIKEMASELSDGEVYSTVEEDEPGYYIVRLDHEVDEEATADKKESLRAEKQQDAFDEIVDGWVEDANIKIHKKVWNQITVTAADSFTMETEEEDTSDDLEVTETETEAEETTEETTEDTTEDTTEETTEDTETLEVEDADEEASETSEDEAE